MKLNHAMREALYKKGFKMSLEARKAEVEAIERAKAKKEKK
jgi:hypothetical protein